VTTGVMLERVATEMPAAVETAETASTAVAVQARAAVEARYKMALMRPRSWDDVRVRLLAACHRAWVLLHRHIDPYLGTGVGVAVANMLR